MSDSIFYRLPHEVFSLVFQDMHITYVLRLAMIHRKRQYVYGVCISHIHAHINKCISAFMPTIDHMSRFESMEIQDIISMYTRIREHMLRDGCKFNISQEIDNSSWYLKFNKYKNIIKRDISDLSLCPFAMYPDTRNTGMSIAPFTHMIYWMSNNPPTTMFIEDCILSCHDIELILTMPRSQRIIYSVIFDVIKECERHYKSLGEYDVKCRMIMCMYSSMPEYIGPIHDYDRVLNEFLIKIASGFTRAVLNYNF
jgi:hypothetical protein